jgi:hypothetical protein
VVVAAEVLRARDFKLEQLAVQLVVVLVQMVDKVTTE